MSTSAARPAWLQCSTRRSGSPALTPALCSSHAAHGARRSFVLLAVLVVMVSAIMVVTSLLFVAQTEAAGAAGAGDAAQSRALLWSGTQAILADLRDQREVILAGEAPALESQYVVYETSTRAGVVRLLPIGPGRATLEPEAGKLDINDVDAAALTRTGLVDAAVADSIVSWRSRLGRPIQSTAELLEAPGVTVEMLYGAVDGLLAGDRAVARLPARGASPGGPGNTPARGLADVVTVFCFEPAVQRNGTLRINLNVKWSDELAKRVEERFGTEAVASLKRLFDNGARFSSDASIVRTLRELNVPPESWGEILDTFSTDSGDVHFGRLDINSAQPEALLGLPGISAEQAAQIVSVREELSPDQRATIAWPALRQIVKPEQYEALAGRITTRCWTYRVRIAAGEADVDEPDGPIDNPQVQEMVIDLCGPNPRLAYLRDVTLLGDTALMALEASRSGVAGGIAPGTGEDADGDSASAGAATTAPAPVATRPSRAAATRRRGESSASSEPAGRVSGNETGDDTTPHQPPARRRIGRWTGG